MIRFPIASRALVALLLLSAALPAAAAPKVKLLLVAMSGPEDIHRMSSPFRHAAILKKSGKAAEVAVVVYGRAVAAVTTNVKSVPEPTRDSFMEARDAGVHVYVCEHSLAQAAIGREALMPGVELVPQGIVKIAELVEAGHVPLQY